MCVQMLRLREVRREQEGEAFHNTQSVESTQRVESIECDAEVIKE